jgi:hypothetical protein
VWWSLLQNEIVAIALSIARRKHSFNKLVGSSMLANV